MADYLYYGFTIIWCSFLAYGLITLFVKETIKRAKANQLKDWLLECLYVIGYGIGITAIAYIVLEIIPIGLVFKAVAIGYISALHNPSKSAKMTFDKYGRILE
jgi:hypothetical protein